jgi:osmotically-inducible protein OsmY
MVEDKQLQADILAELAWEPSLNAAHIGVAAHGGIATLSGHVCSMAEKHSAETATRRVKGVQAIVVEVEVRLPIAATRTDEDIAAGILTRLSWQSALPPSRIKVEVENGMVTLFGEFEWQYQIELALRDAREVWGVRAVMSRITLKPLLKPIEVKLRIEQALKRYAGIETSHISLIADNQTVTLRGHVRSQYEREVVEQAAWSAPGIMRVIDEIVVRP